MKTLCILIFLILLPSLFYAQNLKGKITDKVGEPLYGSTIYIKEINQGLVCNEDGNYQTTLPSGNYTIEYKCLGFKQTVKKIRIPQNEVLTIDVSLEENPFILKEITISSQEDPAYPIMRKAIEKAPVYADAIKEYTADVYIKGNGEILKVGLLVDKFSKKAEGVKLSDLKNQVFIQESYSEIEFKSPDRYKQTVNAFSSSIPDDFDSKDAMGVMKTSLYMPKTGGYVSPLNPKAFSYYKFRYEGFIEDDGKTINKIKIEPKLKDPVLYSGYIYIADNTWHIHSAELSGNMYGIKETYTVTFEEFAASAYLPVAYLLAVDFDLLGTQAIFNYYASLKYKDVIVNENIVVNGSIEKKKKKREFEIAKRDSLYTTISDSLATKRDSVYWADIRTLPLDSREINSFVKKDSIQQHLDSVRKDHHNPKFSFGNILSGGRIGGDSSRVSFKYDGLLLAVPEYNFVDGVWLGQKFYLKSKIRKHNRLEISPYIYYTSARKRLVGGGDIELAYAPMRMGKLKISTGSVSEDFNPNGIHRLINAGISLIDGKNKNHFYQKDYISISNNIDIANGLRLIAGIEIARRSGLTNNTDYTWGKKSKISPNLYLGDRFDKTSYGIRIDYTPYAYYSIRDGAKRYEKFTSPTFFTMYNEGFSSWQTNNSKYRKLKAGLYQNISLSEFSRFNYYLEGGKFFNKNKVHFADYQHFNTSNTTIGLASPFYSFLLLDNYSASTNRYWVLGELNYNSKYILLKRLPFLQGKMFSESLHFKSLYTPDSKLYTEIGYAVNLTHLLNLGVFTSFKKTEYQSFGIRFLFDLESAKRIF